LENSEERKKRQIDDSDAENWILLFEVGAPLKSKNGCFESGPYNCDLKNEDL